MPVTIPAELYEQIARKASSLSVDLDAAIAVLLRYGLQAQSAREAGIASLMQEFIDSGGPCADALGEAIFSR